MDIIFNAFQYGLPAAIVITIYLIAVKFIDSNEKKKQAKVSGDLVAMVTNLNNFLNYFTKDIIDKEQKQCHTVINTSFDSFGNAIINFCIGTILKNNVNENKQTIIENLTQLVGNEYWNVYTNLSLFTCDNGRVCDYLEESWKDDVIKDISTIIFDKRKNKEQRIYNIINKIHILTEGFRVHITNRYAKHNA